MAEQYVKLYDTLGQALEEVDHVKINSSLSIDFDRGYWGRFPALVRRGEYVITRDNEPRFFGRWGSKPIVSLDDLRDELAEVPGIGEPLRQDRESLTYQRALGYTTWDSLFKLGIRSWPTIEHVEVRVNPRLGQAFMDNVRNQTASVVPRPKYLPDMPILST